MEPRALLTAAGSMSAAWIGAKSHGTVILSGTVSGTYSATQGNPDFPKLYRISGSGHLGFPGPTQLIGNLAAGGFTSNPGPHGTIELAIPHGSLTLSLTSGSSLNGLAPSPVMTYQVTGGTGAGKGVTAQGTAILTLDPTRPPKTNLHRFGALTQQGTYQLTFQG
jgi:hypothetical protein